MVDPTPTTARTIVLDNGGKIPSRFLPTTAGYTDEAARDAIGAALRGAPSSGVSVATDDAGDTITIGHTERERLVLAAQGIKGETFSRKLITASLAFATGHQIATMLGLRAGEVVTNLITHNANTGTATTLFKLGIWDTTGALLGQTADISAAVSAGTGTRAVPLLAPYTVSADGAYYLGLVAVATTPPTVLRGGASSTGDSGQVVSGGLPYSLDNSGKTDIGAMALTNSANSIWMAWS